MSTIIQDLDTLRDTRDEMKEALINKGQTVTKDIRTYAEAISNIQQETPDPTYSELFTLASSIYNPGIPDDSSTAIFTEDEEIRCLEQIIDIIK